ncbi:MAG: alpha/beta hydrolase [Solirubrobacteraceae bacterium]
MRVDEHTIEVAGASVFYRSASFTATPTLYLHGIPCSGDAWVGSLQRTGGIVPDLPGFGRSSKASHLDYSLAGEAAFVELLLDALALERVALVAHDWGAGAGLVFAQRHPERVAGLVLCNPLALLDGWRWPALARILRAPGLGELVMGATTRTRLGRLLRRGCADPNAWTESAIDALWAQFDHGTQRAILRLLRDGSEARLAAAGASLQGLAMPALVVWGERDPWFGVGLAEAYAARIPNAELLALAGAGHWPWLDEPAVLDRIAAFVAAL